MSADDGVDEIVDTYLARLKRALVGLPNEKREQLFDSVSQHITEARLALGADSEATVREILERIGDPDDIAAAAFDRSPNSVEQGSRSGRRNLIMGALVTVTIVVIAALVGVIASRSNDAPPTTTTSMITTTTMETITVPVLLGSTLTEAENALSSLRLGFVVTYVCRGGTAVANVVESQSPAGGGRTAEGSEVELIVRSPSCSSK